MRFGVPAMIESKCNANPNFFVALREPSRTASSWLDKRFAAVVRRGRQLLEHRLHGRKEGRTLAP